MTTEIKKASLADIQKVLEGLRELDAYELSCYPIGAEDFAQELIEKSDAWTGFVDGQVACCWGIVPDYGFSNPSQLWMLTTKLVEQVKLTFAKTTLAFTQEAVQRYGEIGGYVLEKHKVSQRWLSWAGFSLGDVTELEYVGLVRPFRMRL